MIFEEVTPGIYQADKDGALKVCASEEWRKYGIGGVINCAQNLDPHYHPSLRYLKLEMLDEMNVPLEWFDQAVLFQKHLSQENKKTVIHCFGAINRSSIVIVACMVAWGMSVHEALNRLPRKPFGVPTIASMISWSKTRAV